MTPPELEAAIFAQQTAERQMRRLRAQAAVLMVIASGAVGFISGRASGWLVPVQATPAVAGEQTAAAGKSSKPPMPVIAPSVSDKVTENTTSDSKEVAKAAPKPPQAEPPAPAPVAAAPASAPRPPDPAAEPNPPAVTVLNPGAVDAGARGWTAERTVLERPAEADRDAATTLVGNPAGVEECERRYSSFRRSDGTYQPFGSGRRQTCPHLR